jgi:hypothetical protein
MSRKNSIERAEFVLIMFIVLLFIVLFFIVLIFFSFLVFPVLCCVGATSESSRSGFHINYQQRAAARPSAAVRPLRIKCKEGV